LFSKLVHLNRKYDLLAKSRVVIDLCAAPGGWLQVAQKYCPQQSLIVGVDLDAIRPIPGVHTFVGDITTQACRTSLKGYLKHFQADLVLHDGAPNVGTAWIQDAFTQSELTLQSLKLATEFLKKGGAFVTKVFRSGDYNSLMWVFNQLFAKVEATKPPSSRNVSAEIFVVCQDFRAPKYIDPKFLDPKHVFKELANSNAPLPLSITLDPSSTQASSSSNLKATTNGLTNSGASLALNGTTNIFAPEKKRRAREGYAEGDYTLYRTLPVRSLVHANGLEAVTVLSSCNALEWAPKGEAMGEEEKVWFESRHTDDDIKESMKDLRVLGKGEFRRLMKWRLAIRLQVGLDVKKKDVEEDTEGKVTIEEPVDEETQVTEEMKRLHEENAIKQKRLKKRQNEKKARTIQRLQLGMTAPEDMVLEDDAALRGEDMFDLGTGENEVRRRGVKGKGLADLVKDTDGMDDDEQAGEEDEEDEDEDEYLSSDDEREAKTAYLEGELDDLYDSYKERMNERDAKWKVKQARLQDRNRDAWHGIRDEGEDGENDGIVKVQGHGVGQDGIEGVDEGEESEEGGWDLVASHKAKIGEEVDSDDDSDSEHSGDEEGAPRVKKVRLALPGHATSAAAVRAMQMANKSKQSLVTNLGADVEKAEMSRQAQVWFDQSIFKDVGDLADLDAGDEEEQEMSDDEMSGEISEEDSDVDMAEADVSRDSVTAMVSSLADRRANLDLGLQMDGSEQGEDDFEVVPVQEDDGMQWDVEDEDQDEVKRQKIQSEYSVSVVSLNASSRTASCDSQRRVF
jgi:AdoMet-dependent rRNA methyltransferase SPB1